MTDDERATVAALVSALTDMLRLSEEQSGRIAPKDCQFMSALDCDNGEHDARCPVTHARAVLTAAAALLAETGEASTCICRDGTMADPVAACPTHGATPPPASQPSAAGDWETPCPKRADRKHCNCWYDGQPCCVCGDPGTDSKETGARNVELLLQARAELAAAIAARDAALRRAETMGEAIEWAWGIIANAGHGDWTTEKAEWQQAAVRWRDSSLPLIERGPQPAPDKGT